MPSVSRRHARIYFEAGGFYVQDLDSSNGTYINGQRVHKGSLTDGDELRCGDFKINYVELSEGTIEAPIPEGSAAPRVVGTLRPRSDAPKVPSDKPRPIGRISKRPAGPSKRPPPRPVGRIEPAQTPEPEPPRTMPPPKRQRPAQPADDELRRELEHWKELALERAVDVPAGPDPALVAERDKLRQQLADVEADLDDKGRRIAELENTKRRNKEQIATLTQRSLDLQDEAGAQKEKLVAARKASIDAEAQLVTLRDQLSGLEGAHQASGTREAEFVEETNRLKREVRQKEKALKELADSQSVARYDLDAARQEIDNLRLALGEDDDNRKSLNTQVDALRQVLAEKEGIIDRLQGEVQAARAEARPDAGDAGESTPGRRVMEQLNELRRANRDLRSALDEARAAGGGDGARLRELEEALAAAEEARVAAEAEAARPSSAAGGVDDVRYAVLRQASVEAYETLNDLASDLRMNVELSGGYLAELQPLVALIDSVGIDELRSKAQDVDAAFTIESAQETMGIAQTASDDFKKAMRRLRELLTEHGYGG